MLTGLSSGSYSFVSLTYMKIFLPWKFSSALDPQELNVNLSLPGSILSCAMGQGHVPKRNLISLING